MRLSFVVILLAISFCGFGQIHKGIKELDPYSKQLDALNEQLRSDPRHFDEGYQKLLNLGNTKNDSALISFLYILKGSYHFYISKKDSAIFYFEKSMDIAQKIGNTKIEITAKIRRVFCDEYERPALELSRRMEENFLVAYQSNDTMNMIYSLNGLGLFSSRMDSTDKALKYHYWALELARSANFKFEEAFVLNNMGLLKLENGMKDSAFIDFMKGLEISQKLKNERLECHLRENLGYYFMESNSLDSAEYEFLYVLKVGEERGFKDLELSSITNLASLEQSLGNYARGDSLYQQALKLAKEERMFHAVAPIYLGLSQMYHLTGKTEKAIQVLDSSLVYAEYSSLLSIRLAYLQLKSSYLESLGKFGEALDVYKEYHTLQDSAEQVSNIASIAELQYRFNDEKKEKQQLREKAKLEVEIKQKEIDLATFRQRLFIVIAISAVIIASFLIYYYRQKQKSERQFSHTLVNKLEEERGRIARDLHDGVGQSLIILKNKYNKKIPESSEIINQNFSEIIEEIRSISRSLIPPELKRLGLRKAIEGRLNEIAQSASIFVTTEIEDLDQLIIEEHQSLRIYRIIQELSTNTLKHSGATAIKLEAVLKENELTMIYQDNGKGFEKDKWKSPDNSLGLRSVVQRLNYLNGTLKVERPKKGVKITMKIQID